MTTEKLIARDLVELMTLQSDFLFLFSWQLQAVCMCICLCIYVWFALSLKGCFDLEGKQDMGRLFMSCVHDKTQGVIK